MDDQLDLLGHVNFKNPTPINIIFSEINYKVVCKQNKVEKKILENVSGEFQTGKLTAILGQSGAGKTSLLKILSGKRVNGVTGKIFINGQARNASKFRENSCCIEQETSMLPLLTVKETLFIVTELKLPTHVKKEHKFKVVSDILTKLGLEHTADTLVGNLSGGELKRLSIGVELVTNPPVMFFDEPTSGLDSVSSNIVVSHLKELAKSGRTIVCVIHQPSSNLFDMFDDILVIAKGKSIYSGCIDLMVSNFEDEGFICPKYYNRADFALQVATTQGEMEEKLIKKMKELNDSISSKIDEISKQREIVPATPDCSIDIEINESLVGRKKDVYAVSYTKQFVVLLKRSTISTFRDIQLFRIRLIAHVIIGVMLGLIYLDAGNEASKVISNIALLFFFILFIFFANTMPTVLTYPLEAKVFGREYHNKWYSLPAYFFSKMVADLPLQITCPTIFVLIAYFMSSQPADVFRVAMVILVCIIFTILSQTLGLLTGVVFNMQMGLFLLPALSIPMLIFSGFFIRFNDVPKYMRIFVYISEFGYGFESITQAVYGFNRSTLVCSTQFCPFKNPDRILKEFDMTDENFWVNVGALVLWVLFLQSALYAALKYRTNKSI